MRGSSLSPPAPRLPAGCLPRSWCPPRTPSGTTPSRRTRQPLRGQAKPPRAPNTQPRPEQAPQRSQTRRETSTANPQRPARHHRPDRRARLVTKARNITRGGATGATRAHSPNPPVRDGSLTATMGKGAIRGTRPAPNNQAPPRLKRQVNGPRSRPLHPPPNNTTTTQAGTANQKNPGTANRKKPANQKKQNRMKNHNTNSHNSMNSHKSNRHQSRR